MMTFLNRMTDNMFDIIIFAGCNTVRWLFTAGMTVEENKDGINTFLNKLKKNGYLFTIESIPRTKMTALTNFNEWPGTMSYNKDPLENSFVDYMINGKFNNIEKGIYQKI